MESEELKKLIEALNLAGYQILQFGPNRNYSGGAMDITIAPVKKA
jgi:hypothetical protein